MACSYLSAGAMQSEPTNAACWTPPAIQNHVPDIVDPVLPQPFTRLNPLSMDTSTSAQQEPALDLTTLKPNQPSPTADKQCKVQCERQ